MGSLSRSPSAAHPCCRRRPARTDSLSLATTAKGLLKEPRSTSGSMPDQEQFLQVLDRDEAECSVRAALDFTPRGIERIPLDTELGWILAADVHAPVDVPSFDRSRVGGFA